MNFGKLFNYSRTIFWIGLVLVVYIFVVLVDENSKNYKLRQQANQLQQQNQQLQADIQNLKYRITYYNSDAYRELAARQLLGLQKPGEQVVIVPDNSSPAVGTSGSSSATPAAKTPPKSNFHQWMDFLFRSS